MRAQILDGDALLDGLVDRFVDDAHPTLPDFADDAVGAHMGPFYEMIICIG
jgi:hypothetical protein